jgi:hypothetical protein
MFSLDGPEEWLQVGQSQFRLKTEQDENSHRQARITHKTGRHLMFCPFLCMTNALHPKNNQIKTDPEAGPRKLLKERKI